MTKRGKRSNDAANVGSRQSNWNNYPWNSNWNIGAVASRYILSRKINADTNIVLLGLQKRSASILLRRIKYEVQRMVSSISESQTDNIYEKRKRFI